ncbi:MAG: hypothetical protein DMF92_21385 [Acidobacteria bacterium]|nr:MAG: hypothetical protein DMF92_21385 [Acidobacteriota bacterium]
MRNRFFISFGAVSLVMAAIVWASVLVVAQAPSSASAKLAASVWDPTAPPPSGWTAPRTSWGDPDLQGFWLVLSYTPLERPAALAGKPLYTTEEAVDAFKKAVALDAEVDPTTIHYDWKEYGMDAWQSPVRPNRRTSLIVDPPDGRIPPRTPEAQKRRALGCCGVGGTDVQSVGWYTRCLLGVEAAPRVPGGVTTESQIVQIPGYVMWVQESNNDVRIIPLDGRPHLPSNVRQYLGDARGHWEGNTLVVETTNFTDETKWQGSTAGMRLVERFTLADPKTLKYEFTVTDPATWTKPWTMEAPLPRIDPPLYEFACHEQNYGVINVVKGAQIRAAEGIGLSGRAPDYTTGDGK